MIEEYERLKALEMQQTKEALQQRGGLRWSHHPLDEGVARREVNV
jgi:hypothetical protein